MSYLDLLEKSLSEFDYLFQEEIVFNKKEIERLNFLLKGFEKIKQDKFFKNE